MSYTLILKDLIIFIFFHFVSSIPDNTWKISAIRDTITVSNCFPILNFIHLTDFGVENDATITSSNFAVVLVTATDSKLLRQKYTILTYLGTQKKIRVLKKLLQV